MIASYDNLRAFALSLDLPPQAEDGTGWGRPCLRAHGKIWVWWSPYAAAAVFPGDVDEREMLLAADPATFSLHPHYAAHRFILVNAGHIDPAWVGPRLIRRWREMARDGAEALAAGLGRATELIPHLAPNTHLARLPTAPRRGRPKRAGWAGGSALRPPCPHSAISPARGLR